MSRRFIELAVRARRVTSRPTAASAARTRLTARRGAGADLAQFSFRLALIIDLAYVGMGALGGAAVGRASVSPTSPSAGKCQAERVRDAVPGARLERRSKPPAAPVIEGAIPSPVHVPLTR